MGRSRVPDPPARTRAFTVRSLSRRAGRCCHCRPTASLHGLFLVGSRYGYWRAAARSSRHGRRAGNGAGATPAPRRAGRSRGASRSRGGALADRRCVDRRRAGPGRLFPADLAQSSGELGRGEQCAAGLGHAPRQLHVAELGARRRHLLHLRSAGDRDNADLSRAAHHNLLCGLRAHLPHRCGVRRRAGRDRQPRPGQGSAVRSRGRGDGRSAPRERADPAGAARSHRDIRDPAGRLSPDRPVPRPAFHVAAAVRDTVPRPDRRRHHSLRRRACHRGSERLSRPGRAEDPRRRLRRSRWPRWRQCR